MENLIIFLAFLWLVVMVGGVEIVVSIFKDKPKPRAMALFYQRMAQKHEKNETP